MPNPQERIELCRAVHARLMQALDDLNETTRALQGSDLAVVADVEGRTGYELLRVRQEEVAQWSESLASLGGGVP